MLKFGSSISEHLAQEALANNIMDLIKAENAALKRENAELRKKLEDIERKEKPEVNQVYMFKVGHGIPEEGPCFTFVYVLCSV